MEKVQVDKKQECGEINQVIMDQVNLLTILGKELDELSTSFLSVLKFGEALEEVKEEKLLKTDLGVLIQKNNICLQKGIYFIQEIIRANQL